MSHHSSDPLFERDPEADLFSLAVGAIASVAVIALFVAILLTLR